ncbi:Sm-like ribonucleoprotein [Auriculariales sp. MPI-PUGE-AT-0066]|nr:Sm-like ribonucleoprotein [Auriculariales sp. MPI-PUGE-AT-0066]
MPPPKAKGGKMLALINWRLKVTLNDGRSLVGHMLAFDRHMNLVLAECEEFRKIRPKKQPGDATEGPPPQQEIKRTLGLIILRGETIISLTVVGPPAADTEEKKAAMFPGPGPGRGMPAGRGMGPMAGMVPPAMAGGAVPYGGRPPPGFPGAPPFGAPPGFGGPPPGMGPPPGFGGPPPGFPGGPR